ncbi:RTA1 like protein-domain-containing protein [Plectosphaerella plurivora]|uniref:RTA1 like protein-domain-containing protein n=1 Tax=Plectosphaerella plurivora TaxID=936078 RepID=A0A9P8VIU6_9PEZI|nr:RTA1 like protein-domain-containing protein [Plectosphaerella plurivora]
MSYDTCNQVSADCPVEATIYGDYFTLGATATYATILGGFLAAQVPLAIRAKTWSYSAWLAAGTGFEFIGYVCRSVMSKNPWNFEAFIAQNLCLVLGPTLVAASISITFKHIVLWYGPEHSLIRPRFYPWVFVGTDFISICIQAAGGGIASGAGTDASAFKLGNNMLLAGVSFQVVNMTFCGGLILAYVWRRRKAGPTHDTNKRGRSLPPCARGTPEDVSRSGKRAKMFIWGLAVAYVAIVARCIYRIPEMAMGWGSTLMQNEATFMSLDGAMLIVACGLLTILHPAIFFPFMGKSGKTEDEGGQEMEMESREQLRSPEESKNASPSVST